MVFENKYDSSKKEQDILNMWKTEQIFKFDENSSKKVFSIDTPPPTISGKMHLGHAFSYTQTDFYARYKRMSGFEVFYPFGTDDNGLPTEKYVQKEMNVNLRKMPREEAIKLCNEFLIKVRPQFIKDFEQVGLSCDFDISYSTINDKSRKISQKSFIDLYNKGLLTRHEGPVMWDRVFQTPIAQAELEDKEQNSTLNYVKAKLNDTDESNTYLIFATTRPELLFACAGFSLQKDGDYVKLKNGCEYYIFSAVTYKDKLKDKFDFEVVSKIKGKDLIENSVIIPFSNKEIKITHDDVVKADFGTGIAYFCSYGGLEDIEYFARHKLDPIGVLNPDGKLNSLAKKYEGLLANDARKEIIKDLKDEGHLLLSENITNVVNVGERSGVEVEYIVAKQWYVHYLDKKEYLLKMANKFNWTPEHMKYRLENWIKGLNWDWGFSRQRHFGIPIPVWYCKDCSKLVLADESQLPVDPTNTKPLNKCECGCLEFEGETDIMDTWFTSASSPSLAIEIVKNEKMKKKLFPMDLRPQSHDIINFWLFYTMAKNNLLYDVNPFKDVMISGFVLDPKGRKMSKSKGNTIAPQEMVLKYSNDALRFGAASTKLGSDLPFQEKEVQTGLKLVTKLYNANKFASMLLDDFIKDDKNKIEYKKLTSIDRWILSKCQNVAKKAEEEFSKKNYQQAKQLWYDFFMGDVADNYIEIIKTRLWQKKDNYKSAQSVLYYVLFAVARGLAPIVPFITDEIYQNLFRQFESKKSIHLESYPLFEKKMFDETDLVNGEKFVEIVSFVRKYKAENSMSMKEEIEKLIVNDSIKNFVLENIDDLKAVCGAKIVEFDKMEGVCLIN
jgi:valyl-tRNA synthetase